MTAQQRFNSHRRVAEALCYASWLARGFVFPWGWQKQITKRRLKIQDETSAFRRWDQNYTFKNEIDP